MLETIAYSIVFTTILLFFYKWVINPMVIETPDISKMSKCPDAWTYKGGECVPNTTSTNCIPFSPDSPSLNTLAAKCNLAAMCGTTWSGIC